jgi:hypothetical protein
MCKAIDLKERVSSDRRELYQGTVLCGHGCVRARLCAGTVVCGHGCVRARLCAGTVVCGALFVSGHGFSRADGVPLLNPVIPSEAFRVCEMRSRGTCFSGSTTEPSLLRSRFVRLCLNGTAEAVPSHNRGNHRRFNQARAEASSRAYAAGAASHFGFISLPHFLGSCSCIFFISSAVSGWSLVTCFTIVCTISSHVPAR